MADQAPVDYTKLKVPELKKLLKDRALPVSGVKAELVARLKGEKYEKPVKEAKRKAAGETSDSKPKKAKKKGETSAAPVENAAVPLPVIPSAQGASNVAASGSKVAASTSVGPNQQASLALESRAAEQGLSGSLTTNSSQKSTTGDVQHAKERLVVQTTQGASTTSNHPPALLRRSAVVDNSAVVQNKAPASVQKVPPGLSRSSAPAKAAQRPPVVKQPHQPFISLPKTAVTASAVPMPKVALGRTAKASLSAIKATVTKRPAFVAPRRIQISQPPANQTPSLVVQEPSFDWVPGFLKTGHSILGVGNLDSATLKMDQKSELIALRFSVSRLITLLGSHNVTSLLETPERISSILSAVISVSSSKNGVAAVQLVNGRSEHVLEANGEVIGHERASVYGQILHSGSAISLAPQEGISSALRPDWTAHISLAAGTGIDVVDCVRSGNEEDYPKGMAKHFKSKYGQTREMLAARAYILSHVAPNAISGQYQSFPDQQAEFSGQGAMLQAKQRIRMNKQQKLFLPQQHCIESVSFMTHLHPALCVVQTINFAHLVVALTGQVVGNEEEGLFEGWQSVFVHNAH